MVGWLFAPDASGTAAKEDVVFLCPAGGTTLAELLTVPEKQRHFGLWSPELIVVLRKARGVDGGF